MHTQKTGFFSRLLGLGQSEDKQKSAISIEILEKELDEYRKEVKMLMGIQKQYTYELINYVNW